VASHWKVFHRSTFLILEKTLTISGSLSQRMFYWYRKDNWLLNMNAEGNSNVTDWAF